MVLSYEERSAINKKCAYFSTGPRTESGLRSSSMNAFVHGMRSCNPASVLPNEDPAARLALLDRWDTYYADGAPATDTLVDRAVMATVHHQRSVRYVDATLGRQVRGAVGHYHRVQNATV